MHFNKQRTLERLLAKFAMAAAAGAVEYQGFLGKFFLAKPRSSSAYSLAADKKQLRIGAGSAACPLATCMSHCSSQSTV